MRLKANSILENIVASVILLVLFIIAGNALNQIFKSSIDSRDLKFDNELKEMEYLLIHKKEETPQFIESNDKTVQFILEQKKLIVEINKKTITKRAICCIDKK